MGRLSLPAAVCAVFLATVLACAGTGAQAAPRNPFAVDLGVYLGSSDTGVCAVQAPAKTRRCTLAQSTPRTERDFGFDSRPHVPGHVVLYRLRGGPATPDTTAVEVRFRALHGPLGPEGPVGPWQSFDLDGPRLQEFPVSVPFFPGDQIGVDVVVHGDGRGEAAAPLGESAGETSSGIAEWILPLRGAQHPPRVQHGTILSLNAVYERDDRTPPRLHWSYARHQDFIRTGLVSVRVRSDEAALLNPECTLHTREAVWGLEYVNRRLHPGVWTRFVCELRGGAARAAHTALVRGGHPRVGIRLVAYDRAGNKGTSPKLIVKP
jgi:hypothetical protein